MAFTVAEIRDLVRLLDEQPEWRAEIRRQLLADEFLTMPEQLAAQRLDIQRIEAQLAAQRREMDCVFGGSRSRSHSSGVRRSPDVYRRRPQR